jgi:hypothetical protein
MKRQLNRMLVVAVPLVLAALVMSPVDAQQPAAKAKPAGAGQQGGAPQKTADAKPQPPPVKADLRDVVRHLDNYLGKTIEVEGEVLDVVPPHLMVIDTRRWFHPWGGVLVVMPAPVAGVVIRDDDQVRVIGKVEKLVLAEAKKRWSFFSDPKIQIDLLEKPIIVATSAVVIPNS